MRAPIPVFLGLLASCATHHFPAEIGRDARLVPADGKIEVAVDERGRVLEVEFHCKPDAVPQAVMRTVESVAPGGEITGCEKEYVGRQVYFEVAKRIDDRDVEIMVAPDGRIHSREIEVKPAQVPDAVLERAADAVPGSTRTKIEEIRNAANDLVEYHVKSENAGIRHKIVLTPAGKVLQVVREATAEIEIPLPR